MCMYVVCTFYVFVGVCTCTCMLQVYVHVCMSMCVTCVCMSMYVCAYVGASILVVRLSLAQAPLICPVSVIWVPLPNGHPGSRDLSQVSQAVPLSVICESVGNM